MNDSIFTEEIDDIGDVMTIEDWKECVESGGFIDDDGFALASNGAHCTKEEYYPSIAHKLPEGTTHIVWYNR